MSDLKYWDVFKDPLWLLHNFHRKYKYIRVPTNAGWDTSNVSGSFVMAPFFAMLNTSVTANSRALGHCIVFGFTTGTIHWSHIDWTKRLELSFILAREDSDTEVVARVQLKAALTEGVLAAKGVGLQVSNFTVVGEAYGTALQTTGTLKTLTSGRSTPVKIVLTSTSVEFWIDGVLVGSLTGTAVPNVVSAATGYLVISIINGATGGLDAYLTVGNIEVVQTW